MRGLFPAELRNLARALAGEVDFFERHRMGEQVGTGGVPIPGRVSFRLRWSLVAEISVPPACEVEIPCAEFLHPCAGSIRSGLCHAGHRPCHVPEISGMSAVALGTVGGQAHSREIAGGLRFIQQVEKHGGHAVFAIVIVAFDPRRMIAIGYRSLARIKPEQLRAALDGAVEGCVLDACGARHHQ